MPAKPEPRHNLTYSEAQQLRALSLMDKAMALKERDLRQRLARVRVSNAAIEKANEVISQGPPSPA